MHNRLQSAYHIVWEDSAADEGAAGSEKVP